MSNSNPNYDYLQEGDQVWIKNPAYVDMNCDEQMFIECTIATVEQQQKTIVVDEFTNRIKFSDTLPHKNDKTINENDLTTVSDMNNADIINNFSNRIQAKNPFTNIGSNLIILNSYVDDENLYSDSKIEHIMNLHTKNPIDFRSEIKESHLFDEVLGALEHLYSKQKNQVILFSGESGSGKTESAKNAIKCIFGYHTKINPSLETELFQFERKMYVCYHLLEAFGHAKTLQNDNSSRFAKAFSFLIDTTTKSLEGIKLDTFLLEKTRINELNQGERNFNIFYQLIHSEKYELLRKLQLTSNETDYNILSKSKCFTISNIDDKNEYEKTIQNLLKIGITDDEVSCITTIIAIILFLGNITFKLDDVLVNIDSKDPIKNLNTILGLKDATIIERAFTMNITIMGGSEYRKSVKDEIEGKMLCNHFAEDLYERLFTFILGKINKYLCPKVIDLTDPQIKVLKIYDVYGFENGSVNSLNQLFINYSNELLQQYFTSEYFEAQKEEFKQQGLPNLAEDIKYCSNKDIIEAFDGNKKCLLFLLKQATTNNYTAAQYFDSIVKEMGKTHKIIAVMKSLAKGLVKVNHSYLPIVYNTANFIFRNKNDYRSIMISIIQQCKIEILKQIFLNKSLSESYDNELEELKTPENIKLMKKQSGDKYKDGSAIFLKEMEESETHHIRCFNSNVMKKPYYVQQGLVMNQVIYHGIAEIIEMKGKGYPRKLSYDLFIKHFELAISTSLMRNLSQSGDNKAFGKKVIEELAPEYAKDPRNPPIYSFGNTIIYMKNEFWQLLDEVKQDRLREKINALHVIKLGIVYYTKQFKLRQYKKSIYEIQTKCKTFSKQSILNKKKKKICLLQSAIQTKKIKDKFNFLCSKYVDLQSFLKGRVAYITMQKKREKIKLLGYRMHIYAKEITNKRQKRVRAIARKILSDAVEAVKVGEYYSIWKKVHPFFLIFKIRKKFSRIVKAGKLARDRTNKTRVINAFTQKFFFEKIKQRMESTLMIRSFILANFSANFFDGIRDQILVIQEYIKRKLERKKAIERQNKKYFKDEDEVNRNNVSYHERILFPSMVSSTISSIKNTSKNTEKKINRCHFSMGHKSSSCGKLNTKNLKTGSEVNSDDILLPESSPYDEIKIKLFTKILDMDLIADLSEIYEIPWVDHYSKVNKMNMNQKTPIHLIYSGDNHTMVINSKGKMYAWGWNNHGQCGNDPSETIRSGILPAFEFNSNEGKFPLLPLVNYQIPLISFNEMYDEIGIITHVACGDSYSFILNEMGNVYCVGKNNKSQLGLGNCFPSNLPRLLVNLRGKVADIKTTHIMTAALTKDQDVYLWQSLNEDVSTTPKKISFPDVKIKIIQIACGYDFIMFLTNNGIVYGLGHNSRGELGLNDNEIRNNPEEIVGLSVFKEKIVSIKCGYKHTLCLALSGKVYSWGVNTNGQLGKGNLISNIPPQLVQMSIKDIGKGKIPMKILHIAAGFRSSFFLMENRSIYYCGQISNEVSSPIPTKFRIEAKSPEVSNENEFCPMRIMTSWSQSYSLLYVTFGDLRPLEKINYQKINMIYTTLATKWNNERRDCTFIQTLAPYFYTSFMKKPS